MIKDESLLTLRGKNWLDIAALNTGIAAHKPRPGVILWKNASIGDVFERHVGQFAPNIQADTAKILCPFWTRGQWRLVYVKIKDDRYQICIRNSLPFLSEEGAASAIEQLFRNAMEEAANDTGRVLTFQETVEQEMQDKVGSGDNGIMTITNACRVGMIYESPVSCLKISDSSEDERIKAMERCCSEERLRVAALIVEKGTLVTA